MAHFRRLDVPDWRALGQVDALSLVIGCNVRSVLTLPAMEERLKPAARREVDGPDLVGLLDSVADGDRAAFRILYQATAPKLLGVILRITGNRAVAEEVLQNAFLKIWQNADRFTPVAGRPMAWLCALARNAAIDQIRSDRNTRTNVELDDELIGKLAAPGDAADPDAQGLRRCLESLDAEARECVVLAYCWGSSREELAERFGRPVNTIKTLLHRNLKTLAACLGSA